MKLIDPSDNEKELIDQLEDRCIAVLSGHEIRVQVGVICLLLGQITAFYKEADRDEMLALVSDFARELSSHLTVRRADTQ